MTFRKNKHIVKLSKWIVQISIFILSSLLYCEYVHYYVVISKCKWPNLENSNNNSELHVLAIADTHLLGRRNGHWFDKLRREWQMHRSFQTTLDIFGADVVIFLGDLFDEGKWCSSEEFTEYVRRFNSLFYVNPKTELLIVSGNHDMGFHYSLNPYLVNRFEQAFNTPSVSLKVIKDVTFVSVNSMAMHGDECFLCKPARLKIESISRQLKCSQNIKQYCLKEEPLNPNYKYSPPVLLQHYPLYRDNDASCSEPDGAPDNEKFIRYREKWECLSKESSNMLLRELQPRLILSGHTHHGCKTWHNVTIRRQHTDLKISALENTIPSYSWRNKKNPSFSMVRV